MASVKVAVDLKPLKALVRHLKTIDTKIVKATEDTLRASMKLAETYAKDNLSRKILYPRTGKLRASIMGKVEKDQDVITARLGILKPENGKIPVYGGAQEFGAEAEPRKAKVMTIPLKAAMTAAGVPKFTALQARELFDRTFWWNDVLYGVKALKGRGTRRRTRGEDRGRGQQRDKVIPLFAAATHVKIGGGKGVGRRYLQEARDRIVPDVGPAIATRLVDLLDLGNLK